MSANQPDEVVRMKLSCRDNAEFLSEFAPKMSSRIFVPMEAPLATGSSLILHIKFQDGEVHVKGRAEVIKVVTSPRSGVHVRFTELDADSIQFALVRGSTGTTPAFVPGDVVPLSSVSSVSSVSSPGASTAPGSNAGSDVTTPGSALPLPPSKPSSPRPVSSLLSDVPPPKPSSPKPVSSLMADAPPPKPSSPRPVSSLLLDPPPPKPSSPKPVSSLLADAPPPKPGSLLSDPRWAKPSYGVQAATLKSLSAQATPGLPAATSPLVSSATPTKPSAPRPPDAPLKVAPDPLALPDSAAAKAAPLAGPLAFLDSPSEGNATGAASDPLAFLDSPAATQAPAAPPAPEPVSSSAPAPRDPRPLDAPPEHQRSAPVIREQEAEPDDLPPLRSSRAPIFLALGLVAMLAVGGGLFIASRKPTAGPAPTGSQANLVVVNLLKKMDEQMMAGRYAGPGGDTALDSLQVALATAPDNARVKEYQEKLASFFERRVAEATANSDHAEAAVQLIALSLVDPKRAGVKEKLRVEEAQVKNQAKAQ